MTHDLIARTITMAGHHGDPLEAYLAHPTDVTTTGGVVVIHHMPGYDESTKELVRHFAALGYSALCPNLYSREAPGASPDDAAALVRANGGVPDERLVGDVAGAMDALNALPIANGKVASIGYCSGGRQSFLAGCRLPLAGVIDCYGAFVVIDTPPERPFFFTAVVGEAAGLTGEVLGLFGAEDEYPSPDQTAILEERLTAEGKKYEMHTFENAGHGFFAADRPSYRPVAATEAWEIIDRFLARTIGA
jgi:carboxymethylenebutenolidase